MEEHLGFFVTNLGHWLDIDYVNNEEEREGRTLPSFTAGEKVEVVHSLSGPS